MSDVDARNPAEFGEAIAEHEHADAWGAADTLGFAYGYACGKCGFRVRIARHLLVADLSMEAGILLRYLGSPEGRPRILPIILASKRPAPVACDPYGFGTLLSDEDPL